MGLAGHWLGAPANLPQGDAEAYPAQDSGGLLQETGRQEDLNRAFLMMKIERLYSQWILCVPAMLFFQCGRGLIYSISGNIFFVCVCAQCIYLFDLIKNHWSRPWSWCFDVKIQLLFYEAV